MTKTARIPELSECFNWVIWPVVVQSSAPHWPNSVGLTHPAPLHSLIIYPSPPCPFCDSMQGSHRYPLIGHYGNPEMYMCTNFLPSACFVSLLQPHRRTADSMATCLDAWSTSFAFFSSVHFGKACHELRVKIWRFLILNFEKINNTNKPTQILFETISVIHLISCSK